MTCRYLMLFSAIALLVSAPAAWADEDEFEAELSGAEEFPDAVETDTTGKAKFEVEDGGSALAFELEVEDAVAVLGAAGAHIHCGLPEMNGPVAAFLAGELPGGLNGELEIKGTLSDENVLATDCGTTLAELIDAMAAGETYVNVHSSIYPGGVVRGQIEPD